MAAAISVENLSRSYRVKRPEEHAVYRTLREDMMRFLARPWRWFGQTQPGDQFWALRDVSFEVPVGSRLGIIGHNGAGKSTLLKVLSRISRPTTGRAVVRGRVGSLLEVGTGFHTELTGRENIHLSAAILGMSRTEIRRKFDVIVEFSGIERFLDTPVKRYSSGMYVRLAFAVASHLEPEILILDEVLAVGDPAFQRKCLARLREVAREGRTVLFVSHNMAAIRSFCDRAIVLNRGAVLFDGDVGRAVETYHDALGLTSVATTGIIPDWAPRMFGTLEARFRSVQLQRRNGEPTTLLCYGEPFRVFLEFEVLKDFPDGVLELGVVTREGEQITFSSSIDGERPLLDLRIGHYRTTVDVDLTLIPGEYSLLIAVHHLTGPTIDWLERTLTFTVVNVAKTGTDCYPFTPVRGYVRPETLWAVDRAD